RPGDNDMADVEVDGDLVEDHAAEILPFRVAPRRQLELGDRGLDEQRRVGVALAVILRVKGAEANGYFSLECGLELDHRHAAELAFEILRLDRRLQFLEAEDGRGRL